MIAVEQELAKLLFAVFMLRLERPRPETETQPAGHIG